MALTRAQLLAGNQLQGTVLPGQPQGVIAGAGVTISTTGVISVDASSVTGLVKLNNTFGYNAYVWPNADGSSGEFLKTDGAGNLDWATPQGFAVVTVKPQPAPSPTDVGELWFDCTTGTLNVWQNCVGTPSPNWFNVAQPGLPVDPTLTSASPNFTGGDGTAATPYTCTVTTTATGTTVFIVNTVTVTGLAPGQYVPIVDTDAVTNGGRFSFSNNYADATGTLTFQTIFSDLPPSTPGTSYLAKIKVGYATAYIDSTVNIFSTIPTTTWNPGNGLNTGVPGTSSATWNGATGTVTATDCVVLSTDGTSWSQSVTATNGQPLYVQWNMANAGTCGKAPTGTTIQGTVNSAAGQNSYSIQVNRKPNPAVAITPSTNVTLNGTVTSSSTATVAGLNATAYITLGTGSTGTNIQVSTDNVTFINVPSAPSEGIPVINGQTIYVRQTVGSGTGIGYTANLVIGDSTGDAGAAATFQAFTYTATTTSTAAFPGVTFTPVGGPNAANETVLNVTGGGSLGTLNGVANSNSWPAGLGTSLSSPVSGANPTMKFRVNGGGSYVTSGLGVVPTDVLNLAWNEAYLATVADGGTANGSITGTVGATAYTNTFTMTVKRSADWSVPSPAVTGAALSTQQTTGAQVVNNFNVPVTVTFAAPTTGTPAPLPMTDVSVSVGGQTAVPVTLGTTTVTLNPGQSIQVYGKTGGTSNQPYGVKVQIGTSAAQDWLVTTAPVTPTIQTPVIGPPADGAVNVGTSSGITISGSTYTPLNNPGAHGSSDWEVYKDGPAPSFQSTATISAVAPAAVPAIGSVYGGGYFAGQISTVGNGVADYNLVVAPYISGSLTGGYGGNPSAFTKVLWKNSANFDNVVPAENQVYGAPATAQFGGSTAYPMFNWCRDDAFGPNAGVYDTTNVTGTGIGGFNDWYIPAKNELEILYYNLKPGTTNNNTSSGINPNAVPARASAYTSGTPSQTVPALFRTGGLEAFTTLGEYWSSTQTTTNTSNAWLQDFTDGRQVGSAKSNNHYARAIRRVPVTGTGSTQLLSLTGANTDGFTVGMAVKGSSSGATGIITAIDGTSVTITQTSATAFNTSDKLEGNGTAVVNVTNDATNKTSYPVAAPPLAENTTYFARVKYNSVNNPPVYSSAWSAWSKFTTGSFGPAGNATLLATNPTVSNIADGSQIYYDGSTYAFGAALTTNPNRVFYSTNLTSWNNNSVTGTQGSAGFAVWTGSGGRWVYSGFTGVSSNAYYASTPSGAWTLATAGTWANPVNGYILKDSNTVFYGNGNKWGLSTDGGLSYTVYTVPNVSGAAANIYGSGTYFNGAFLLPGYNGGTLEGLIARSTTAATAGSWTFPLSGLAQIVTGIASSPTAAVAICDANQAIYRSTDGITWNATSAVPTTNMRSVAYGAGAFIAVGRSGSVWVSSDDGLTWVDKTSTAGLTGVDLIGINYVNSKWLALSGVGTVYQIT